MGLRVRLRGGGGADPRQHRHDGHGGRQQSRPAHHSHGRKMTSRHKALPGWDSKRFKALRRFIRPDARPRQGVRHGFLRRAARRARACGPLRRRSGAPSAGRPPAARGRGSWAYAKARRMTAVRCSAPADVDDVLARMRELAAGLDPGDGVAVFNRVYLSVTEEVARRLAAGTFPDGPDAAALAVRFAARYLAAVEDGGADGGAGAPACWRPLLRVARASRHPPAPVRAGRDQRPCRPRPRARRRGHLPRHRRVRRRRSPPSTTGSAGC